MAAEEIIGSLKVLLGADTKELETGVGGATEMLKKFAEVAAAAAGPAALGELIKSSIEAIDTMYHLAEATGGTVAELQILEHAGKLAGVSADTMATSLEQLNRHLGDAAINGGAVAQTLQRVGLNAKDLLALPLEERFLKIAAAINQYSSIAVRTALSQELLGRGGVQLVGAMGEIAEKVKEAEEHLAAFGALVSQTDAKKIVEADDAFKNLSLAVTGLGNSLAVKFAPTLSAAADAISDMITKEGLLKTVSADVFDFVIKAAGYAGDAFRGWQLIIAAIVAEMLKMQANYQNIKGLFSAQASLDAKNSEAAYRLAMKNIDDILAKPLPSEALDNWQKHVVDTVSKAENAIGNKVLAPPVQPVDNSAAIKAAQQELQQFNALRDDLTNKAALEDESYKSRLAALDKFNADGLVSDEDADKLKQSALLQHQQTLMGLIKQGGADQNAFQQLNYEQQAESIFGELQNVTSGVAQHNRELFEINKVAGIANAVLNAYVGISKTLASYPYPFNLGLAALHAAVAFAQVDAIASSSYTGGGGTAPALSGSTAAPPTTPVDGGGNAAAPSRTTQINISGVNPNASFSGQQVRDLITAINQQVSDGAQLNIGFN